MGQESSSSQPSSFPSWKGMYVRKASRKLLKQQNKSISSLADTQMKLRQDKTHS